jgi:deoxyribonuclease-1-like protein
LASFNIQVFGQTKASKPEVMEILADIIRRYNIVAIQEIRDAAGTAILTLRDKVNEDGAVYEVVVGPRVGRTSSKEQYAFIYDSTVLRLLPGEYTYDDDGDGNDSNDVDDSGHSGDLFEREPFVCFFRVKGVDFDFGLVNIHTKPDDATAEIGYLDDVMVDAEAHLGDPDIICLGDFNADGSYYNEDMYQLTFPSDEYIWLIGTSLDTTVASSDNTYDRIVVTMEAEADFAGDVGILRFDTIYDFSSPTLDPDDVSDHFPVWARFNTESDTE